MKVHINPSFAEGTAVAPPSKSMAHRMLICAAMSAGKSVLHGVHDCEDVSATIDCLAALGIKCEKNGDTVTIYGRDFKTLGTTDVLKCRESGSTLRFLIPPAMLLSKYVVFSGEKPLMRRPMNIYQDLAKEHGQVYMQDSDSIIVKGPLSAGEYTLPGNVSSQFISGLLFALPTLPGDSIIKLSTSIESRSYINMTLYALSLFGVKAQWADEWTLSVPGNQKYMPSEQSVEGDYSNAAFLEALNLFGFHVKVEGLIENSTQGDRVYRKFFQMFDRGIPSIHLGDCPDLGPVLFAIAAAKNGGIFSETRRLRIKESNRGESMKKELEKFGVSVKIEDDSIVVYPTAFHKPDVPLFGHNDHRIVMALSILLTITGGTIEGAEAVKKSYPDFFETLMKLGVDVTYEDM